MHWKDDSSDPSSSDDCDSSDNSQYRRKWCKDKKHRSTALERVRSEERRDVELFCVVRAFRYVLNYPLIKSFDFRLVESYLVDSQYLQYFGSMFPAQILL